MLLHLFQSFIDAHVVVEISCRAHHFFKFECILLSETEDEVFQADNAQRVVKRAVDDGISLIEVFFQDGFDFLFVVVYVERYDVGAVGHERADLQVAQKEYAFDDVLFHFLHFTIFLAFLHDGLDFFLRHLAFGFLDAQQVEHGFRALGQYPDERSCDD